MSPYRLIGKDDSVSTVEAIATEMYRRGEPSANILAVVQHWARQNGFFDTVVTYSPERHAMEVHVSLERATPIQITLEDLCIPP